MLKYAVTLRAKWRRNAIVSLHRCPIFERCQHIHPAHILRSSASSVKVALAVGYLNFIWIHWSTPSLMFPLFSHFCRDQSRTSYYVSMQQLPAVVKLGQLRPIISTRISYYLCFPLTIVPNCALSSFGSENCDINNPDTRPVQRKGSRKQ